MKENIEKDKEEENEPFRYKDIVSSMSVQRKEKEFELYEINSEGDVRVSQGESTVSDHVAAETIAGKDDNSSWYIVGEDYSYTHTVIELLPLAGIVIGIIAFN